MDKGPGVGPAGRPVWLEAMVESQQCCQGKKQQLEANMEQQTGSKWGKYSIKAVYYNLAYLTNMQSTSCEMPGSIKYKLELRLPGKILTSDMQMTPPLWQKAKRN